MNRVFLLSCVLLASSSVSLHAQSIFGAIVGTVKDASGALVNRARVTITNIDENTSRFFDTNEKGSYEALNLKPGHYTATVASPGFQESTKSDIALDARQTSRIDFSLEIGTQTQTVNVEGQAGVVASESDAIASSYGSEKLTTLPANFRASTSTTPYPLLTTLPGVQLDSGNDTYLSIQGGLPNQSELSIDGISAQSVRQNRPLIEAFPSTEGIAEIKVQGVGNTAEYSSAGDITTVSKSGTNVFHGAAAWYYQNADFDAIPYGSNSKPAKDVNNYSFAAGGPVLLPKLYNGRNRTFFFADFEGLRYPRSSTFQNFVATALEKTGNFSKEAGTILDPTTGKAFPGNIIPASRISSISQTLQKTFFPDPNNGDANVAHSNNYNTNKASDIQSKQFDLRGDQYFGSKQSVFARFSLKNASRLSPNNLLQPDVNQTQENRSLVVSHNYAIKPNLLNEFRLGYTTDSPGATSSFNGPAFQNSLGFNGLPSTPFNGITNISFNNLTNLDVGRLDGTELYRTFVINNNVTWTLGAHTLKTGFDIRWMRSKTTLGFNGSDNYGNANFTGTFTGNEYADYLLGLPNDTSYGDVQHDNDGFSQRYQAFAQDSWRFNQKLTLEYGVRWDYNPPFHDQFGYVGNFDPSVAKTGKVIYPAGFGNLLAPAFLQAVNACPGTPNLPAAGPGLPGVPCTPFVTNKDAGLPLGLRKEHQFNFFPRFGFAYRPFSDGNTVVRGGFGIYDAPLLGAVLYSLTGTAQTDVRTFNNVGPTGAPIFAFPNTRTGGTGVSADSYGTSYFGTANAINLKNPYMIQWNLSFDRNIGFDTGLRISYIGSHSVNLGWSQNYNQSAYSTTFYAQQPLTSRPFPYWGRVENRDSGGTAFYHSLQTELNRRFHNGLTFTGAYTLAKNISDIGGPNPSSFGGETGGGRNLDAFNRAGSRGDVYGTRRYRFISTALYDLPVGHGRAYLGGANRIANALIVGWQLSTIFLAQSGPYETPYFNGGDPSGTGSGTYRSQRPDRIGDSTPSNQSRDNWINGSAFTCPGQAPSTGRFTCKIGLNPKTDLAPIGRFGNSGVGIVEGPGTVSLSAGLGKAFAIHERLNVRISASFTNILNHTNLADPILNLGNANFGKITSAVSTSFAGDFGGARTGQVGVRIEF